MQTGSAPRDVLDVVTLPASPVAPVSSGPNLGVNDYPGCCGVGQPPYCGCGGADLSCRSDQWGYGAGQCTSFCAHRLAQGGIDPRGMGDASQWPGNARRRWGSGAVSSAFRRGDIAYLPPGCHGAGLVGHVAVVLEANTGGITVEQYNFNLGGGWCQYTSNVWLPFIGCGMLAIHPPWSSPIGGGCPSICPPCQHCVDPAQGCVSVCEPGQICANGVCAWGGHPSPGVQTMETVGLFALIVGGVAGAAYLAHRNGYADLRLRGGRAQRRAFTGEPRPAPALSPRHASFRS